MFFLSSAERFLARAFAPACPDRTRPDFAFVSSISPVAIRRTWTALPITSEGRFSPLGPLGTVDNPSPLVGEWIARAAATPALDAILAD
jgi:hypothetical protein